MGSQRVYRRRNIYPRYTLFVAKSVRKEAVDFIMQRSIIVCLAINLSLVAAFPLFDASVCDSECFDCGIEYSGDNLNNPIDGFTGDAQACQMRCQNTAGCKFFAWRDAGTCLLKTKVGNKNGNSHAISGGVVDKCKVPDVCFMPNVEYSGNNCGNPFEVTSFNECYAAYVEKNKKSSSCGHFTYRAFVSGTGTCLIKSTKGNSNPNQEAVSGPVSCNKAGSVPMDV